MKNLFTVSEVKLSYKQKQKASERPLVQSSHDTYKLLMKIYDIDTIEYRESMKLVLLNRANKVLGVYNLSEGGIDGTYCDVRQILQIALLSNASGVILSHNHPSGNISPSIADKRLTTAVKQACDIMNIRLLDHLIVAPESFYSFTDEGLI